MPTTKGLVHKHFTLPGLTIGEHIWLHPDTDVFLFKLGEDHFRLQVGMAEINISVTVESLTVNGKPGFDDVGNPPESNQYTILYEGHQVGEEHEETLVTDFTESMIWLLEMGIKHLKRYDFKAEAEYYE